MRPQHSIHVLHVSVWKGKYGSWLTLVNLEVSQICDHFNVIISECLPHDRFLTYLRAILESKETNIFNRLFSFVIGRPFDHVFEFQLRTHCLLFIWPLDFESSTALERRHGGWQRILRPVFGVLCLWICRGLRCGATHNSGITLKTRVNYSRGNFLHYIRA